jgi:hypothetical protein
VLQALPGTEKALLKLKKPPELFMGTRPEGWPQFTMSLWWWKLVKPLTISTISTPRKTKKTADIVAAVAAKVKEDWRITW